MYFCKNNEKGLYFKKLLLKLLLNISFKPCIVCRPKRLFVTINYQFVFVRLNSIIEATGANSYHGFLPTIVRNCIQAMTGNHMYFLLQM